MAAHHGGSPAPDDRPPLSAVAQRSGYGSAYAFANAFKREYRISAGRYRTASEPVNRGG
jgi:AraC-like DNA-binding protein